MDEAGCDPTYSRRVLGSVESMRVATAPVPSSSRRMRTRAAEICGSEEGFSVGMRLDVRLSRTFSFRRFGRATCWSTCSTCSTTRRLTAEQPTICSVQISVSPPCSWPPSRDRRREYKRRSISGWQSSALRFRQIDQDDIRVLTRAVKHDLLTVRCDVKAGRNVEPS